MTREKVRHYSLKEPGRQQVGILNDARVRLMVRTGEKIGNPDYLGPGVLDGGSGNSIVPLVTSSSCLTLDEAKMVRTRITRRSRRPTTRFGE
jgi:hypothetical protein